MKLPQSQGTESHGRLQWQVPEEMAERSQDQGSFHLSCQERNVVMMLLGLYVGFF